jgi:hypothetical protein
MTHTRVLAVMAMVSYGCAGTIEVSGGPTSLRMQVQRDHLLDQIGPLVAADPQAAQRVSDIRSRERIAKILLYSEFAMVLGCIGGNASSPDGYTDVGIGLCIAGIVLGIGVLIVQPKQKTYGDPLRVYNRNNPQTRYVAPELGVQ